MNLSLKKKFQIYNSLFLNLNYEGAKSIGHLIPILSDIAKTKLSEGQNPIQILDAFYSDYEDIIDGDKIEFMFKVIRYVERQVVLFDSIEDSVSPYEIKDQDTVLIETMHQRCSDDEEKAALIDYLNDFSVRIVFTAHPTQFYRPPVLDIMSKLRKVIQKNNTEKIDRLLHQLGLTSLVNTKTPTPLEEAKNIIHICRYEYYEALGDFFYNQSKRYPELTNENLVGLGFWPCGDRDGNPYVTYDVTNEVINTLRMTLMKCYYKDVKSLSAKMTFRDIEAPLTDLQSKLYEAMFDSTQSIHYSEILKVLQSVEEILKERYESLYLEDLERLKARVLIFKNHFASLDIRQDHSVHLATMEWLLKSQGLIKESIQELSEDELSKLLLNETIEIPSEDSAPELVADTIRNIRQIPKLQALNGEEGCHRYIISNSEDIYSVLFVWALFRWIHKTDENNVDIIPLFETMNGMEASEDVMRQLYSLDTYRTHLNRRTDKQTIMLGFSDGTKDGGYLKANWSIFKCKETLSRLSAEFNVSAIFFDGRGGPPARGGGMTHNFYAARSSDIANTDIQLTIQGQTITSTYGTKEKFTFNAEQMITSGLKSLFSRGSADMNDIQRALIEELSQLSYEYYIKLKKHPKFLDYLENMTTLRYYAKTKIGSRPGKRNKTAKLSLTDLRAISYVGSWSQLKQNIPGYYGLGHAIQELDKAGRIGEVQALYQEVPLFRTLLNNSMMSLTKCNFELTGYMANDAEFGEFWTSLHDEYQQSKDMILKVTNMSMLMEDEQASRRSIMLREEIVRPLLIIQHYALQVLNTLESSEDKAAYEKLVVRSLYGNINASRNSA